MIDVNVIVTCCDREAYWPYLKKILLSYTQIMPHIAFCYNGKDDKLSCDYRHRNEGKTRGDARLIAGGWLALKDNGVDSWLKLSVDSWLCREQAVVDLFQKMSFCGCHYAGIPWHNHKFQYSTDIIFADSIFMGSLMSIMVSEIFKKGKSLEETAKKAVDKVGGKVYIVNERLPYQRHHVVSLGWTMQHDLKANVELARKFGATI